MSVQDVPGGNINSLRIVDSGASMHKTGDIRLRNTVTSRRMLLPLMEREGNRKEEEYIGERIAKIWFLWFLIGSSGKTKAFADAMWKTSRNQRFLIVLLLRDFSVATKSTLKSTPGGYPVWESAHSLQCTKQLQDTVFKFLISPILVDF
ncbi:hypothetical protein Hanom_Chr14g01274221 [Helianthus anomalus]